MTGARRPGAGQLPIEVWAPLADRVEIEWSVTVPEPTNRSLEGRQGREAMTAVGDGWWRWEAPAAASPGTTLDYAFVLDGAEPPVPDPRSAWQPHGVHGPSRTFDPTRLTWTDHDWRGPRDGQGVLGGVVYELHIGTFTAQGTFDAAVERLDHLVSLGVDVVNVMPVAAFDLSLIHI